MCAFLLSRERKKKKAALDQFHPPKLRDKFIAWMVAAPARNGLANNQFVAHPNEGCWVPTKSAIREG
jgi:hypothetical protein